MKIRDIHTDFTKQITQLTTPLRRFALQLTKDSEDANDLVQDTLLKAYRYWHSFKPNTNLKAWLFTIMRNTFMTQCDRLKRERRVVVQSSFIELGNSVVNSLPSGAIDQTIQDDIMMAVAQLRAVHREPLLLHVEGFKYYEIAHQLSIPIGTVKHRIHIARRELQRRLPD
jgi:RNA polymerase sigma-70 factor (ECF subfamily)